MISVTAMRLTLILIIGVLVAWAVYLLVSAYLDYRRKARYESLKRLQQYPRHGVTVEPPIDWQVRWPEYDDQ